MRNTTASAFWFVTMCVLALAFLAGEAAVGRDYWVSTTGNDADAGTKDKPFATLDRARDALREAKKAGSPDTGATVWLSGGDYYMEKTFELDAQDSGTAEAPVVYRSVPGQKARLVGGRQLASAAFKPVTNVNSLERLDPSARGKVVQADLKALGITDYGRLTRRGGIERNILPAAMELFFNDRPMPLARWPNAGTDNGAVSCDIYNTGECGIILAGGDRRTLEPGRNYAVNNRIYNFGRWVRTYRPAVFLCGVGNRVAHNLMYDAPHTAVFFLGNDHVLEFNEVYRVCTETGDAGAFYIGRDWSQRGSIVRYNYFHDLGASLEGGGGFSSVMGVYLDDQASGITVFGNIFCRVNYGVLLGGGRDNTLENNIFASCDRAIHLDARGVGDSLSNSKTLLDRLKAANHDRPPYSQRYPELAAILDEKPGEPKGNVVVRNICVGGTWDVFSLADGQEFVRTLVRIENNRTEGDPGLVAPQNGDFRLKNDSAAMKLGFKPIPVEKIGLYQDEYR